MSGPDRIWVDGDATGSKQHVDWDWDSGCWGHQQERDGELEYIRADLVPQWQPIETARKDGTYVIGLFNGIVAQMKWSNGGGSHSYHWMALGRLTPIDPTHWMPLPALPKGVVNETPRLS